MGAVPMNRQKDGWDADGKDKEGPAKKAHRL